MTVINDEDIVGYYVGEQLVCLECITNDGENKERQLDELLTQQELEKTKGDKHYFCDRCNKEIV